MARGLKRRHYLAALFLAIACQPSLASAKCMSRPFKDAEGQDRVLTIVIPEGESKAYQDQGFAPASCGGVDVAAFHKESCRLVKAGNSAVQKRLEQVFGALPAKLCKSAKLAMDEAAAAPAPATPAPTAGAPLP